MGGQQPTASETDTNLKQNLNQSQNLNLNLNQNLNQNSEPQPEPRQRSSTSLLSVVLLVNWCWSSVTGDKGGSLRESSAHRPDREIFSAVLR